MSRANAIRWRERSRLPRDVLGGVDVVAHEEGLAGVDDIHELLVRRPALALRLEP